MTGAKNATRGTHIDPTIAAAITDTVDDPSAYVEDVRQATRSIIESSGGFQAKALALIELAADIRANSDPTSVRWAERVVWEESRTFLGVTRDEPHEFPPTPYELAQHRLRDRGLSSCPTCLASLATDYHLERWRQQREDHIRLCAKRDAR